MKHEIYYATSNSGKFDEAQSCIKKYAPFIELKQLEIEIEEIQSLDQKAIAIDKAKKAYDLLNKPLLVDDGGIFLDAYNQFPGTLTKFVYQGIGLEGILKLIEKNNKAAFILTLAYTDGKIIEVFEGRCDGTIVTPKNFDTHSRLPYGAIFKPNGCNKTYAEMYKTDDHEKYGYRFHAIKKFISWYSQKHEQALVQPTL